MGIESRIAFAGPVEIDWPAIFQTLKSAGFPSTVRMIDGLPAFPDETPEPGWSELRLGFPAGMVTLRRAADHSIACIVWGSADQELLAARDALAKVVAESCGGHVVGELA